MPVQVEQGMEAFLSEWVELQPGESMLAITRTSDASLVGALKAVAADGARTVTFASPAKASFDELALSFSGYDAVVYLEGTSSTHSNELQSYLETARGPRPKFLRVFDFTPELFTHCFNVSRYELERLNSAVVARGSASSQIVCKSSVGTDLEILIDDRFGWIDSCGRSNSTTPGVLPASEAATFSDKVNGIVFADGAVNTNFGFPGDPRLESHPVRVEFVDSEVKSVSCDNPVVHMLLLELMRLDYGGRVGEVGFGTNIAIPGFVPFLSHINERYPALHLGLGGNNQGAEVVGWQCPLHFDLILGRCTLAFDGDVILDDGHYVIDQLGEMQIRPGTRVAYVDTV